MALAVALAVAIGIALGLLGGGGSILTVPLFVYGLGLETKSAIATSLLVVGLASFAALIQHARTGLVSWRTGFIFGAAGMVGAFTGGRLAVFIPPNVLLVLFALMMLATAISMLRRKAKSPSDAPLAPENQDIPIPKVIAEGLVVGVVTGLVGAGGGFLIVPALVLLGGMSMPRAVATSLLVIAMKSMAGFAGYLGHVEVDWVLAGVVTLGAIAGTIVGTRLAHTIAPATLRRIFGWFVLAMAIFILGQQLPQSTLQTLRDFANTNWLWLGISAVLVGSLAIAGLAGRRRLAS